MNKIIFFFIVLSSPTWAQESFNIKTSQVSTDEGLTPNEVRFIYNSSSNTLEILDDGKSFHFSLNFHYEGYDSDQEYYSYGFKADPTYSNLGYAIPVIRINYDKKNGKISHIAIGYFDENNKVLVEPVLFVTDYGLEYMKIVVDNYR